MPNVDRLLPQVSFSIVPLSFRFCLAAEIIVWGKGKKDFTVEHKNDQSLWSWLLNHVNLVSTVRNLYLIRPSRAKLLGALYSQLNLTFQHHCPPWCRAEVLGIFKFNFLNIEKLYFTTHIMSHDPAFEKVEYSGRVYKLMQVYNIFAKPWIFHLTSYCFWKGFGGPW